MDKMANKRIKKKLLKRQIVRDFVSKAHFIQSSRLSCLKYAFTSISDLNSDMTTYINRCKQYEYSQEATVDIDVVEACIKYQHIYGDLYVKWDYEKQKILILTKKVEIEREREKEREKMISLLLKKNSFF